MKKETNANTPLTYNNEFRWAYVWRLLGFVLLYAIFFAILYLFVIAFFYWVGDVSPTAFDIKGYIWLLAISDVILFVTTALKYFRRMRTGEYSIVGNNLIVREQYFSCTTNLTIPISCITNVKFTPYFIGWKEMWKFNRTSFQPACIPYRFLEITVGDQKFVLHCYAHAEELYNELCKYVGKDNTNL